MPYNPWAENPLISQAYNGAMGQYNYANPKPSGGNTTYSSTVFNPATQSQGSGYKPGYDQNYVSGMQQQIDEYQRRLSSGEYDGGQFSEFGGRILSLQNQIKQHQKQYEVNPATALPDPNKFSNPDLINNFYNQGLASLYQSMNRGAAGAQRTAAATSGNMLSPGAYITGAGSQVRSAYAPAFGQLEQGRSGALMNQQTQLYSLLNMKALAEKDWEKYGDQYNLALQQFQQGQMQYQNQYNQSQQISGWDVGRVFVNAGSTIGSAAIIA